MYRDILTNKWIIGGVGFLIVFAVACVLWYQHETAPYRQQAIEAAEIVRQMEAAKEMVPAVERSTEKLAENTPVTAGKQVTQITTPEIVNENEEFSTEGKPIGKVSAEDKYANVPDIPEVSPHGFGPFPEVPPDFPFPAIWLATNYYEIPAGQQRNLELIARVLIKLWSEGERNYTGAKINGKNGKVYPNYSNTVYITVKERLSSDGTVVPYITRQVGRAPAGVDLLNPPPHIKVLDYESAGIDPYQYLNLP